MISDNNQLPLGLHTPTGPFTLTDPRNYPKKTIDYLSGDPVDIIGVREMSSRRFYRCTFDDGREILYREDENIFLGQRVISFGELLSSLASLKELEFRLDNPRAIYRLDDIRCDLLNGCPVEILTPYQRFSLVTNGVVKYEERSSLGRLQPDPYTAGAILPNADFAEEYVNLPGDRTDAVISIIDSNGWQLTTGTTVETVAIKRSWAPDEEPLPWSELFSRPIRKIMNLEKTDIPSVYQCTSVPHRFEFIRGFFDTGYELTTDHSAPLSMEIRAPYLGRLRYIQNVLLSLGILSKIHELPNEDPRRPYVLELIMKPVDFPILFNDVEKIERLILKARQSPRRNVHTFLRSLEMIGIRDTLALDLGSQKRIYLTDNFLPRVSY